MDLINDTTAWKEGSVSSMENDDSITEIAKRAQGKPCPWCGEVRGYRNPTSKEGLSYTDVVQMPIVLLTEIKRFWKAVFTAKGIMKCCKACSRRVDICPGCDTPLRSLSQVYTCKNCGTTFMSHADWSLKALWARPDEPSPP